MLVISIQPSMKGGRTAPRNEVRWRVAESYDNPSMKGGRTAPRNRQMLSDTLFSSVPSMKGGRTAPRNGDTAWWLYFGETLQ